MNKTEGFDVGERDFGRMLQAFALDSAHLCWRIAESSYTPRCGSVVVRSRSAPTGGREPIFFGDMSPNTPNPQNTPPTGSQMSFAASE